MMSPHEAHAASSGSPASQGDSLLAIAVGNTRISAALFAPAAMGQPATPGPRMVVDGDAPEDAEGWAALSEMFQQAGTACVASVHSGHAERVRVLAAKTGTPLDRIGAEVAIPVRHTLDDASTLGQDRALNSLAAFALIKEAVVVVDAGTAVTIDFVDGTGVFHGGLILPGLRAMLDAMHTSTHALPSLTLVDPTDRPTPGQPGARGPFGKDTAHAMRLGVCTAVNGAVRLAAEQIAMHYEAYPRVIATGGDAWLFEGDDSIVERILPELQLLGIHRAWQEAMDPDAFAHDAPELSDADDA